MSGILLDEKENVDCTNEFSKEAEIFSASSILKPSQKENVCQLTFKKPPKVTFKNTPVRHHPTRYEVEQPNNTLDSWQEIRCLDEVEHWTERTQVVTKEDHQLHRDSAKEFLDNIIDNLPCFSPTKDQGVQKSKVTCSPSENKAKVMEDSLDVAGPLDPAIASLNSLLKAGEEEERAFSPIGSGKISPDCDMVTSDDIEKLLASHDVPDKIEIPSLELLHGNKIDAYMDSKFSGRHLDEVAAKLSELKLTSTNTNSLYDNEFLVKPRGPTKSPQSQEEKNNDDFDLPIKPRGAKQPSAVVVPQEEKSNDDFDLPIKPRGANQPSAVVVPKEEKSNDDFDLPIKPRGAKQPSAVVVPKEEKSNDDFDLPIKPQGGNTSSPNAKTPEEYKQYNEVKENGNGEEDLPVKRRQPKPVHKKDVDQLNGEEKETFKKPMPPKPWKTKRKKVPPSEDPFSIMFAEPAKSISANDKAVSSGENPEADSCQAEQKPLFSPSNGVNSIEAKPSEGEVNNANKDANGGSDGVNLSEVQEDFGFTNDDFQPGNAFSLELDYLEKFGNSNNLDRLSALARQSLYVKFDPLCKGRSPDQQGLQRTTADANASKQTSGNIDDLLMTTPPNRRAQTSKLTSIKESSDKDTEKLSSVDKLLTFSPLSKQEAQISKTEPTKPPAPVVVKQSTAEDASLVQPLLYSKSDIETAVKKEREALLKQTNEESQVRDMEIQEIVSKLQTEVENNSKLKRENDELKTVMKEYEKTMTEMIESSEKDKNTADESKNEIVKERDQLQADLNSVEAAFSDLHRRYEKIKGALENFKKNEEILKKAAQDYQEKLRKSSEKYQMLKKHAEEKIETANIEINRVRRSNDSEMAVMRAALKKEQNKSASLEQAVKQKINENKELTAICDELIQRASGK